MGISQTWTKEPKPQEQPTRPDASRHAGGQDGNKEGLKAKHPARVMWIMAFFVLLIPLRNILMDVVDNDAWFIMSTGREILQNGFPYINPFTMIPDMGIIVQQWIPDVLTYLMFSNFGSLGLMVMVSSLYFITVFLMFKVGRMWVSKENGAVIVAYIGLLGVVLSTFISIRPTVYTMIFLLLEVLALEKYKRTNDIRWLVLLPVVSLCEVNFHASMWPLTLGVAVLYMIPIVQGVKGLQLTPYRYRIAPIAVALLTMVAVGFINPYGINGMLYMALSYGSATYGGIITELEPTKMITAQGLACLALFALLVWYVATRIKSKEGVDVTAVLFAVVTFALAVMHIRNTWFFLVATLPVVSILIGSKKFSNFILFKDDPFKAAVWSLAFVFAFLAFIVGTVVSQPQKNIEEVDDDCIPVVAIAYLDQAHPDAESRSELKIYNSFNSGGYLEWRGYKTFMDPRPELYNARINHQGDFFNEYVDLISANEATVKSFVEKYDFDYLIADTDSNLEGYLSSARNYELVESGNGYNLYKRDITGETASLYDNDSNQLLESVELPA